MKVKVHHQLDTKGLTCPIPIVRTKRKMAEVSPGEVLVVEATDRGSTNDIEAWANSSGNKYLGTKSIAGVLYHYLRKTSRVDSMEVMTYEKVVNLDELREKLGKERVVLVDVREPAEFALNHIEGAISIPLGEIETQTKTLNKQDEIYLICRTGNRSDLASKALVQKGFENVYNVVPGMTEWKE